MDSQVLEQLRSLLGEGQPTAPAPAGTPAPSAPLDFSSQSIRPDGKPLQSRRSTHSASNSTVPIPKKRPSLKQPLADAESLDFSKQAIVPGSDYSGVERFGQNTLELLKGIPAGAGGLFGSSLKGLPAFDSHRTLQVAAPEMAERIASIPDMSDEEFAQLLEDGNKLPVMAAIGFRNTASLLRSGRMTPDQYRDSIENRGTISEDPAVKAGDWVTENADIFPAAPGFENSVGRNLGQGVGSVVAGVGTTLATGGLGGAAIFTLAGSGEALQRALDEGATDEQILEAARLGAIPGLTDQIPIETLLSSGISPSKWPVLAIAAAKIGKQALIEGMQEGGQEFLQNLIAKYVYKPDQELTEGLPGSAGLGAGTGAIVEATNQGARLLAGRRGRHAQSPTEETPSVNLTESDETQGPDQPEVAMPPADLQAPASAETPPARAGVEQDGAAGAEPTAEVPTASIADLDTREVALLTSAGYDTEDILDMSPEERSAEAADLETQGVKPDFRALANEAKGAGTRADPAQVTTAADVERASSQTNQDPTDAQKEAGNYAKGHIKLQGMNIAIENPKGSERSGKDPDGQDWSVTLPGAYGYIKRTEGADGDQVDVFIGDNPESDFVLVVDQIDPSTGKFDEHKAILGTNNADEAIQLYKDSYSDDADARIGGTHEIPVAEFKTWARIGDTSKPFATPAPAAEPETETIPDEQSKAFDQYVQDIGAGNLNAKKIAETLGVDERVAGQLLSQAAARGSVRLDNATGRYRRKPTQTSDLTLMQALAANGGIQNEGGELSAIGVASQFIPGRGRLVRKSGMTLDQAREFAVEAGYLRDNSIADGSQSDSTVRDLLDALDGEARGSKTLTEADQNDTAEKYDREADEIHVEQEVGKTAEEYGIDMPPDEMDLAVKLILDDGMGIEDAIEAAAIRLAQEAIPEEYADIDIPFETDTDIEKDINDEYDAAFDRAIADLEATEQGAEVNDQTQQTAAPDSSADARPFSEPDGRSEAEETDQTSRQTPQGNGQDDRSDGRETSPESDVAKSAPEHAHNVGKPLDPDTKYEPVATGESKVSLFDVGTRQEISDKDFLEITDEFAAIFEAPEKSVRLAPQMRKTPFISVEDAQNEIESWKAHAKAQGKNNRSENSSKTILSLFDLTGQWSEPWEVAGYNVIRFDIQSGQDVMDFSVEYFNDNWDFSNVYGVLAACPCTDFASSGAKWFKDKDADGRTEASKELVFQTMRTIEYFRPIMWALENPVGRIGKVTGLPPYRMSFDPSHFGEPYTKKTVLFGNFETDLPTAHVEPTEGSKMWKKYGGKSQATKNARSETPAGFAYSFFMANNAVDMADDVLLPKQYPEASGAVSAALKAGVPVKDVEKILYDTYENYEHDDARKALFNAAQSRSKPSVETGADNKPQTVIPGAERISDKENAERQGEGKLKPRVPQKDAHGLFGDDRNEQDLFENAAKTPRKTDQNTEKVNENNNSDPTEGEGATDTPTALKYLYGRMSGGSERMAALFESGKPTNKQILDMHNDIAGTHRMGTSLDRGTIDSFKNRVSILRAGTDGKPERVEIKGTQLATEIRNAYTEEAPSEAWSDPNTVITNNQELIDLGRKAFKDGEKGKTPIEILDQYGIAGAKLWQRGWSTGNLDAPNEDNASSPFIEMDDAPPEKIDDAPVKIDLVANDPTIKSVVKKTGMGIKDAAKGLDALFNDPKKLGSGPAFDEETYQKALPYFRAAAVHFADAASDISQMVTLAIKALADDFGFTTTQIKAMRPYLRRFISDIKTGKETLDDVSDSNTDLEPDSTDAAPGDGLGPQNIPAAGSKDGRRPGSSGGSSTRGGSAQPSNQSVSGTDAPLMGTPSGPDVSNGKQPSLAPDTDRNGGRSDRDSGAEPTVDSDGSGQAVKRVGKDTRLSNAERASAQVKAENVDIKVNDEQNIRDTLPILYPLQQDDVIKAEKRFFGPEPGFGMLYTNGTGTGKTFTGLGIIKRFLRMVKKNILIVSPAQPINDDWVSSGELLGIDISILPDIQSAGDGVVITTYANLEANNELIKRDWDLVIADESHKLMSNGKFEATGALNNVRALTRHPEGKFEYHRRKHAKAYAKLEAMVASKNKTQAQIDAIADMHDKLAPLRKLDEAEFDRSERKPVVFLSATPFPYDKSIDYANGYLFDYAPIKNERMGDAGYNVAQGREAYFVQHFGYRMRYNKLTQPEADVDQGLMQRAWHEHLRKTGSLSGRQLEVEADYERKFALVESQDGKKIDQAFEFMMAKGNERFRPLYDIIQKKFDYLRRAYLLEAIKARAAIPIIKKHHALGRKVVVFHEFNKGGGFNPFSLVFEDGQKFHYTEADGKQASIDAYQLLAEFFELNPYAENLDFSDYKSPIETLKDEFANVMIFGGKTTKKEKAAMKKAFNADGTEDNLIAINSAAGEAGISLHDLTGEHQRVIINLGLPNRPVTAIQTEGRIYRVGQVTDAIFIYMDTGTNWERFAFASKMASRSGTAENLALGNLARNLQQSYVDGYLESDIYVPSKNEGKGGKEADRPAAESISPWDMAKTYYFAKQKIRDKRSQRAGDDYFATPEPLGLKMVEWSRAISGDEVLEPSAGHGAISRFFPEGSTKRIIEPSPALGPEAALNTPGADLIQSDFEDHNIVNKYDAIVMNPPFGIGGSDAIPHLAKAFNHLRPGGRVVALLPMGPAADKKFDAWWENVAGNAHMIAEIKLPTVTFERAGTKTPTRVVVIDRAVGKDDHVQPTKYWNYTGSDTIKDFFDRLEQGSELPDRVRVPKEDSEEATAAPERVEREVAENTVNGYIIAQTMHAKKGFPVFVAQIGSRVDKDRFKELVGRAKALKGWYSSFSRDGAIPGFQFKSQQARDAFVEQNPTEAEPDTALSLEPEFTRPLTPLAENDAPTIEAKVRDIVRQIAGSGVDILTPQTLTDFGTNTDAVRRSGGEPGQQPTGAYQSPLDPSIRPIIHIALSLGNDPRVTTAHESWHHLEFSGLVTPMEMAIMTREDQRLRAFVAQHVFKTDTSDPKIGGMPTYEVRAYAFQEYFRRRIEDASPAGLHIGIRRFFDRLFGMFRRIRNALTGMGYRTTEDVFQAALRGDMRQRTTSGRRRMTRGGDLAFATHGQKSPNRANYAMPGENPALPNWLLGRLLNRFLPTRSEIVTKGQDRFHQVNRLQKEVSEAMGLKKLPEHVDTYLAESLYYGRTGERLNALRERYIEPLSELMHEKGVSMQELNDFLYARHAPERNAAIAAINKDMPVAGSGMSTQDAKALMAKLLAQPNAAGIKEAAKKVDDITAKARKTLTDSGLISPETLKDWQDKYSYYVPLRGFENDPDTNMEHPSVGRGFDVRGKEAQRALGRKSRAEQPLLYAVQQAEQAVIRAEKNRVAKTFLRFIRKNPNKDLFEIARAKKKRRFNPASGIVEEYWIPPAFSNEKNLFAVKIGGKVTWVQIHHPALARAMRHMGSENLGTIGAALAKITRYLAMINTSLNPEFVVSNIARDLQTALVNISETEQKGIRRDIVKAIPAAMKGVYQGTKGRRNTYWTKRYGEFAENGGKISFHSMQNIDTIRADLEAALKDQTRLRRGLRGTFQWIDRANGAVENALRLATYDALIKRGKTVSQAASVARELTVNFNRKGEWGAVINAMYLFFNAALQGTVRMGQAMYRSPTARKIAVGLVGVGVAMDIINFMLADDDEDGENFYDKIPQWEKERNFILMIPGSETGQYVKIPLAYGYNVFSVMGQQIGSVSRGVIKPTDGATNMLSAMLNAFMPIGTGATPLQTVTPTVARPFVEIAENKNWFGGPIYPTEYPNSYQPDSSRSFQSISPPYKWMAEALNKLSGGNEVKSGLVDFSPEVFEHLVNFTTGGAGTFWLDRLPNTASNFLAGDPWLPEKTPFVRRVYNKKSEYVDRGTYYDMRDRVMALRYEIKEFSEDGNQKAAKRARDRDPALTSIIQNFEASEKAIRQINKRRRMAMESGDAMSKSERKTEIERLDKMRLDVMTEARKAYYRAK